MSANSIALWDGTHWSPIGEGLDGGVWGLAVYNGDLIAVGELEKAGELEVNNVARWGGISWSALGSGVRINSQHPGEVSDVTVFEDGIVVVGIFADAGGNTVSRIARWED